MAFPATHSQFGFLQTKAVEVTRKTPEQYGHPTFDLEPPEKYSTAGATGIEWTKVFTSLGGKIYAVGWCKKLRESVIHI